MGLRGTGDIRQRLRLRFTTEGEEAIDRVNKKFNLLQRPTLVLSRRFGNLRLASLSLAGALIGITTIALGKFLKESTSLFIRFEERMNRVRAVTGATGDEFASLTKLARQLGKTTVFTATQAAEGLVQLAQAGLEVEEIISALPKVLDFAAAAQLDLAAAAKLSIRTVRGFGLEIKDFARVNDVLVSAANNSTSTVAELGEGLKLVAPIAAGLNLSIEDTVAILGKLADASIVGGRGGRTLRSALARLVTPSGRVADILDRLSISTRDANNRLRPLVDILDQLVRSGATAEDVLAIFGRVAGPGLVKLVSQGTTELVKFKDSLDKAAGTAARTADIQLSGLVGSLKILNSALQELGIQLGTALAEPLADIADIISSEGFQSGLSLFVKALGDISKFTFENVADLLEALDFVFKRGADIKPPDITLGIDELIELLLRSNVPLEKFGEQINKISIIALEEKGLPLFLDKLDELALKRDELERVARPFLIEAIFGPGERIREANKALDENARAQIRIRVALRLLRETILKADGSVKTFNTRISDLKEETTGVQIPLIGMVGTALNLINTFQQVDLTLSLTAQAFRFLFTDIEKTIPALERLRDFLDEDLVKGILPAFKAGFSEAISGPIQELFAGNEQFKAGLDERFGFLQNFSTEILDLQRQLAKGQIDIDQVTTNQQVKLLNLRNQAVIAGARGLGAALISIAQMQGEGAFKVAKAFAIADAIISTLQGANKALALGPIGIPLAAAIVAQGFARVAQIRATEPRAGGGRAGGAGGFTTAGGGAFGTEPGQPPPVEAAARPGGPQVNITVQGFVGNESELATKIGEVFREAVGDDVDFNLDQRF